MTETKTICLEETDLKRILAEKFKTDENSISFKLIDPDGYGIHIETKIEKEVQQYRTIGMQEECREAVDKQIVKGGGVDG